MEGPAYLPVGTEVSAKYRGAFCEAKVKKIVRAIKIKVFLKETGLPLVVSDEDIKGSLKIGNSVEVKHPESGLFVEANINKITDQSMYTVVFDDGDENTLRRTQLCLKGEKHFVKTDTLDELPLTNPEHFGTPVLKGSKKKRRSATMLNMLCDSDSDESSDEAPRRYWGKLQQLIGRVFCMQQDDRKKSMIVPVLVVQPNADETILKTREHLLVKSFKDSKFYSVLRKELKDFTRETAMKNDDKALKSVYEKALLYYDAKELPQNWDREEILGSDSEDDDDDEQSTDGEQSEEKDMFVAQLYKFMDDRGTPINKGPVIGTRDLNLHRLFRIVQKFGGYNRVTNQMKWRLVYSRMGLPNTSTASAQIRSAYKKYLHAFEDFYRKLGSSMGTITRPSRNRHSSGRNIPGFRDRGDKSESSPRSPRSTSSSTTLRKVKDEGIEEVLEETKVQDVKLSKSEESVKEAGTFEVDSPSKRKTRTMLEDRGKLGKEKRAGDSELLEKDEFKVKRRPVRKKLEKASPKAEEGEEMKKPSIKEEEVEESDSDDDDDAKSSKTTTSEDSNSKKYEFAEFPPGSRLKVKYGKGKNEKMYEAKVLDCESEGGIMHYLVHYNGWNVRYDEWIKKDRVTKCIFKSDGKRALTSNRPTLPGAKLGLKKKAQFIPKAKSTPVREEKDEKIFKSLGSKSAGRLTKPPRPTRSTSLETNLSTGLSVKKRSRRNSGHTETSDGKSRLSDDDSTDTDSNDEPIEEVDDTPMDLGSLPHLSDSTQFTERDPDKLHDNRDSAFDIIKELQADMDFDKASQDSLERDLNIKLPELEKLNKNESDEALDINDLLSCLKSDEYKLQSSENESVKSDLMEKRTVRGKTKTKGELKAKPELLRRAEGMKAKSDTAKAKPEVMKGKNELSKVDESKQKAEQTRSKIDLPRAKLEIHKLDVAKPKEPIKSKVDAGKSKSETSLNKQKPDPKTKPELSKTRSQELIKTKAELKGDFSAEKTEVEDVTETEESSSSFTGKEQTERATSSGEDQVTDKPSRGRPRKDKDSEADREESTPTKTRARGRGKRRVEKEEVVDSEEEPLKKRSRKKPRKSVKEEHDDKTAKLSSPSGDDLSKEESGQLSSQESTGWTTAPELTATPKLTLEDLAKDIPDEAAPPLSPVNITSVSSTSQPDVNSYDLRGAMESTAPGAQVAASHVDDTPPQTPENNAAMAAANQTPHHDVIYEASSTKSEMEANLEVEKFLAGARPPGDNSPSVYDASNVSTASDESINQEAAGNAGKRKAEDQTTSVKRKRTKKGPVKAKQDHKRGLSDFEDEDSKDAIPNVSKLLAASSSGSYPALSKPPEMPSGAPKYDFVQQIESAKFLERDQRVNFLFSKISDLRSVYMQLKAEVASIDKKRKRFRKKQRLAQEAAAHCLIGLEQSVL